MAKFVLCDYIIKKIQIVRELAFERAQASFSRKSMIESSFLYKRNKRYASNNFLVIFVV